MSYILGIDQSTSSTKALLFDETCAVLDKEAVSHEQIYPKPGWVEHDAQSIWENTLQACKQLLDKHPEARDSIQFISITNQRETFLLFEKEGGRPVGNAIVWQCTRSEALCESLKKESWADYVKEATGLEIDSYFSAPKLKWLIDENPELVDRLNRGDVLFGTIDTYLIYRMTEGRVYATDHTNASRTMLYNLGERKWDCFLCKHLAVDSKHLPTIMSCEDSFGLTTLGGILPKPTPIQGVMGDSQAALFAQRCFTKGSTKVTLGTGSSLLYNIGPEQIVSSNGVVTTLAAVVQQKPTYCFEGIIRFSSATMDWLQKQLGLFNNIKEADELAESVGESAGVFLVPAFTGLGAPYWNSNVRAAILGLTAHSNRAHIIRAGFESMAFQVRDVLEMMESEVGYKCDKLNIDGGPTKSPFLMQLIADILQRPISISKVSECSAMGSVMLGMLGSGIAKSLEDLCELPRDEIEYRPQKTPAQINDLYSKWKEKVAGLST